MTARQKKHTPKFRLHKGSGQGFVELGGQRRYLGRFELPETKEKYHRAVAEWLANGRRLPVAPEEITVVELCARFWRHAETYYRKPDGTPTSEIDNYRQAIKPLTALYGTASVSDLGPRAIKAVRQRMIDDRWCRTHINKQIGRIKKIFRWGVAEELVGPSVFQGLQAVEGLKKGRCDVAESAPVRPVPQAHIDAVRPHVSSQVWALIQLQLLTGARPGELVKLRAIDLDTSGEVWTATLGDHKTAHRGKSRVLVFGPKGISVLRNFMSNRSVDACLFSPREAAAERATVGAASRRRPEQTPSPRKTERRIGDHYTRDSYRRAIHRACEIAAIPKWSPNQLRHNAATEIRRRFGIEAAQVMLGHAKADVTQIYAEVNRTKALEIAAKIG